MSEENQRTIYNGFTGVQKLDLTVAFDTRSPRDTVRFTDTARYASVLRCRPIRAEIRVSTE